MLRKNKIQWFMSEQELEKLINPELYQVFLCSGPVSIPFNFASHTWFVINKKGIIERYEVIHKSNIPNSIHWGHIYKNLFPAFSGIWRFISFDQKTTWKNKTKLISLIEGGEGSLAFQMIECIEKSIEKYPYKNFYRLRGPNSNTYVQWILNQFPKFPGVLPKNAIGKNFK